MRNSILAIKKTTNLIFFAALIGALAGCSISHYVGDNAVDKAPPIHFEEEDYKVKVSEKREQWDHPNILAEPRINFSLESNPDKTEKLSRYDDDNHLGIYSLRLDGSDFRTVLTPEELLQTVKYKITDIDHMQRSYDNRYLAILSSRSYLDVIDLKTKKRVARVKEVGYEKFYWLKDKPQILFVNNDRQFLMLDVTAQEGKQVSKVNKHFRSIKYKRDYEYYADINKLVIITDNISVYNFATGALLERSPKEYYKGNPSVNSNFRIDKIKKERGREADSDNIVYYRQGHPAVVAELPYKTYTWTDGHVEFGPKYIYKASSSGMYFDSIINTESRLWTFDGYVQAKAITITNPLAESYEDITCDISPVFCEEKGSWQHSEKRPAFNEDFNMLDRKYRFSYEERQPALEKLIQTKNELEAKKYQSVNSKYITHKQLTSLEDLDKQAQATRDLYAKSEYTEFAKNILDMSNQLNSYLSEENVSEQQSEAKKIVAGERFFSGLSAYDINTNLANASKQCLKAAEDPIKYLSFHYYLNNLSTGYAFASGRDGRREGITEKLRFLTYYLAKNGYKDYAKELLDHAHESFGQDLVVYLQSAKSAHESDYKKIYGSEYNAVGYMIMYDLVGDKQRLNDLIRNTKEEIYTTFKSERVTLARKRYFAKKLATYYIVQGNKKEADKVLGDVAGTASISSFLYRGDSTLRRVYGNSEKKEVPTLKYWKEFIAKGREAFQYDSERHANEYEELMHDYGAAGVKRAYEVLPMLLAGNIIYKEDVTALKMHLLEHMALTKHVKTSQLLAEMEAACEKEKCGSRYEDQWTLRLMHSVYKALGKKQKVAEVAEKMRSLEEGQVVDLSKVDTSRRGYSHYYVMDQTSSAEEVIAHIKQHSNNPELYEGLMEEHSNSKEKAKHLAYLKEMLAPKFWPDTPGEYFETVLPELTSYVQKDPDVIKALADTSCGLLFDAHFRHNPDHLTEISTSF